MCDEISSLKIFVWYGAGVWRRLIPMLVITFSIFYVWQEAELKVFKKNEFDSTILFDQLENAINSAQDGAVLRLAAGDYLLSKSLDIRKSITLIGAGKTNTRVLSSASGYALFFEGIQLHLQGIDFEHIGQENSDVLLIQNSTFSIEDCRFTGSAKPTLAEAGVGLYLYGYSDGVISKSLFDHNSTYGMYVANNSSVKLEQNKFNHNGAVGVAFWDTSQGDVSQNSMQSNELAGIAFTGFSKGRIYKNIISKSQYGIRLRFDSQTSVIENTFQENSNAIYLAEKTQPTFSGNVFQNNDQEILDRR